MIMDKRRTTLVYIILIAGILGWMKYQMYSLRGEVVDILNPLPVIRSAWSFQSEPFIKTSYLTARALKARGLEVFDDRSSPSEMPSRDDDAIVNGDGDDPISDNEYPTTGSDSGNPHYDDDFGENDGKQPCEINCYPSTSSPTSGNGEDTSSNDLNGAVDDTDESKKNQLKRISTIIKASMLGGILFISSYVAFKVFVNSKSNLYDDNVIVHTTNSKFNQNDRDSENDRDGSGTSIDSLIENNYNDDTNDTSDTNDDIESGDFFQNLNSNDGEPNFHRSSSKYKVVNLANHAYKSFREGDDIDEIEGHDDSENNQQNDSEHNHNIYYSKKSEQYEEENSEDEREQRGSSLHLYNYYVESMDHGEQQLRDENIKFLNDGSWTTCSTGDSVFLTNEVSDPNAAYQAACKLSNGSDNDNDKDERVPENTLGSFQSDEGSKAVQSNLATGSNGNHRSDDSNLKKVRSFLLPQALSSTLTSTADTYTSNAPPASSRITRGFNRNFFDYSGNSRSQQAYGPVDSGAE